MASKEETKDLWMVPYSSLVTVMVLFFLSLYAMAAAEKASKTPSGSGLEEALAKIQGSAAVTAEEIAKAKEISAETAMAAKLRIDFEKLLPDQPFAMEVKAKTIRLTLPGAILFDLGSDLLKEKAKTVLSSLSETVKEMTNPIVIAGHTDSLPIRGGRYDNNRQLATARAFSVIRFLTKQGLNPERLQALGYGPHRPIASNDTPEGRAQNRRIEIILHRR